MSSLFDQIFPEGLQTTAMRQLQRLPLPMHGVLVLDADPTLTPDEVKCRLMITASPMLDGSDQLAYSVL